jgi:hypothetical protein
VEIEQLCNFPVIFCRLEYPVEEPGHELANVALDTSPDCEEVNQTSNCQHFDRCLGGDALRDVEEDREEIVIWETRVQLLELIGERLKP